MAVTPLHPETAVATLERAPTLLDAVNVIDELWMDLDRLAQLVFLVAGNHEQIPENVGQGLRAIENHLDLLVDQAKAHSDRFTEALDKAREAAISAAAT